MNIAQNPKKPISSLITVGGFDSRTKEIADKIKDLNISKEFDINNYFNKTSVVSRVVNSKSIDEVLFDARAQVKIETSKVSMHLNTRKIEKLFSQIDSMHDPEEWDESLKAIELISYKSFLMWYLLVRPEKGPGLGLSNSGNLVAAWVVNKDRLILEFLPQYKVKWFVVETIDGDLDTASGTSFVGRLPTVLAPYDVDSIFFKKDK